MGIKSLTRRHADRIAGVVSCCGRLLIFGTLAAKLFRQRDDLLPVRARDPHLGLSRFAEPFRQQPRENAARLAADNGLKIEHIRKKNFRKEDL